MTKAKPRVRSPDTTNSERQARWRAAREAERTEMIRALRQIAHQATTIKEAREIAAWTLLNEGG